MKDKQLLSLMFEDAAEFRAELLEGTLRAARRKRRVRRCGQVLTAVTLVAGALWWTMPRTTPLDRTTDTALEIISTQPLPAEQIVATTASKVALVEDEELLALVPGETKLLVWHAPHEAELVILDTAAP